MPLDHSDSEYFHATEAAKIEDTRTADQRKWDKRCSRFRERVCDLAMYTRPSKAMPAWNGEDLVRIMSILSELRDLGTAIGIDGFRPGSPVPKLEAPKRIDVVPVEMGGVVDLKRGAA